MTPASARSRILSGLSGRTKDGSVWPAVPVSPFHSLTRLKDSSVERHRDKSGLAVTLRRRQREQEGEVFAERPKPGDCKPHQRGRLKRKAKTECGLIGRNRIMPVLRRPLLDHDKDGEIEPIFTALIDLTGA
jgi:hypothetical protein